MATEGNASPPPELAAPSQGALARLIGVLFSPAETFPDIVHRPAFIVPLLVVMGFSLALWVVIGTRVGAEQIVRRQIESHPRMADLPQERREEIIDRSMGFARVWMYVAPLVFLPLAVLVISGVLWFMADFVFGAEATFRTMVSVTLHGLLPSCILAVVAIITIFLKDPADFDVQNMVYSNLGPLFENKVLGRLGSSMDLFSFWQIWLLARGTAAASRFSFGKGLASVMIPWALWVLAAAGWAAIF